MWRIFWNRPFVSMYNGYHVWRVPGVHNGCRQKEVVLVGKILLNLCLVKMKRMSNTEHRSTMGCRSRIIIMLLQWYFISYFRLCWKTYWFLMIVHERFLFCFLPFINSRDNANFVLVFVCLSLSIYINSIYWFNSIGSIEFQAKERLIYLNNTSLTLNPLRRWLQIKVVGLHSIRIMHFKVRWYLWNRKVHHLKMHSS